MKRLLILMVFGMMWSNLSGCCLWRGPACQQCPPPAVTYAPPCAAPCQPAAPCARAQARLS